MAEGKIIAGVLAPHPPHLVYGENPPQNEPKSECGWETLRWGYENCRKRILTMKPDVFLVHSPHWMTVVGHQVLGLPRFKGLSIDPIFPNLFRYEYDLEVDLDLSLAVHEQIKEAGLVSKVVKSPNFRVDYGAIISLHMINPDWNIPVVTISSNNSPYYYSNEVGQEKMTILGNATRKAIEQSGKRAVLLASNSMSHRHFTSEPEIPEDMSFEHIYRHSNYLWDMKVLNLMKTGKTKELLAIMPEYFDMASAEVKAGALTWMLSALEVPDYPATIHAYGSVIGTGNGIVEWNAETRGAV